VAQGRDGAGTGWGLARDGAWHGTGPGTGRGLARDGAAPPRALARRAGVRWRRGRGAGLTRPQRTHPAPSRAAPCVVGAPTGLT